MRQLIAITIALLVFSAPAFAGDRHPRRHGNNDAAIGTILGLAAGVVVGAMIAGRDRGHDDYIYESFGHYTGPSFYKFGDLWVNCSQWQRQTGLNTGRQKTDDNGTAWCTVD